jgi:mRNA (guanine-N7-)-methyltransferase
VDNHKRSVGTSSLVFEHTERPANMYDPARDTFTAPAPEDARPTSQSDNPEDQNNVHEEHSDTLKSPPRKKLKASSPSVQRSPLRESKSPGTRKISKPPTTKQDEPLHTHENGTPAAAKEEGKRPNRKSEFSARPRPSRSKERADYSSRDDQAGRKRRRSPTPDAPPKSPPRSPPRQRKRPGQASRIAQDEKEALRQRQIEREKEQQTATETLVNSRGVHDVVRQHYNAVPQRGREWRRTDSRIKGLRSYNNWVKSVLIQKFSPSDSFTPGGSYQQNQDAGRLLVLDIGCGKGGDLMKWQKAPQQVELYVGVDPAEVSIEQARERYAEMRSRNRGRMFQGEFFAKDGYGEWIGEIPIVKEVGVDAGVGPGGGGSQRWGGGGFDVVTMMFCMHYAYESEAKARGMLKNVAGSLKKGGRFIGVIPNSDVLRTNVENFHKKQAEKKTRAEEPGDGADEADEGEVDEAQVLEWGNEIYRVRFPGKTPEDGIFRPPYGWKYSYFMEEAVEEVPEYVVPWEAFRALAEDYNLEMQYRKPFLDIWREEKDDAQLGQLSERMQVRDRDGNLQLTDEEKEAVAFYHAFCFYKV